MAREHSEEDDVEGMNDDPIDARTLDDDIQQWSEERQKHEQHMELMKIMPELINELKSTKASITDRANDVAKAEEKARSEARHKGDQLMFAKVVLGKTNSAYSQLKRRSENILDNYQRRLSAVLGEAQELRNTIQEEGEIKALLKEHLEKMKKKKEEAEGKAAVKIANLENALTTRTTELHEARNTLVQKERLILTANEDAEKVARELNTLKERLTSVVAERDSVGIHFEC